jgi:enoyl-CoA hydratase/carnithine racemase
MVEELITAFERINENADISVVILRGAEGAFCSGLDLKEFGTGPSPTLPADFPSRWRYLHELIFNAGAALALACDLLIVGHSSLLQVGEIQRGMAAPMNLAWLRIRHSEAMAARVILVGEPISGVELSTMGLAHACVDDSHVFTHCSELAHRLATFDVAGVMQMKRALREAYAEGRSFQDFLA